MLSAEVLVPLIIGVLGFIYKSIQDYNVKKEQETDVHLQKLKEPLATNNSTGVSVALDDQHQRVSEEIRSNSRRGKSNNNQTRT